MGDISAEPSMEEILSSIKRIIAEEGDTRPAARRSQRAPTPAVELRASEQRADADEVLELREPMPVPEPRTERVPMPPPAFKPAQTSPAPTTQPEPPRAPDPIVSHQAAAASRGSLDALTRLIVKPESADNTLEGLVRELLRPMLREWLDAKLPEIVEAMVAREIERITGSQ